MRDTPGTAGAPQNGRNESTAAPGDDSVANPIAELCAPHNRQGLTHDRRLGAPRFP